MQAQEVPIAYCKPITITSTLIAFVGLIDSDYKSVATSRSPFCQSITIMLKARTKPAGKISSKFSKFITTGKNILSGDKTEAQNYQKFTCTASKLLKTYWPKLYNSVFVLQKSFTFTTQLYRSKLLKSVLANLHNLVVQVKLL